jgi:hypothetical protein
MPEHEVAKLLTLNIGMTLSVLLAVAIGVWAIVHEIRQIATMTREVATMTREILRRRE